MRYNQFIFMSDILENNPDIIIKKAAEKHIDLMIVAVPAPNDIESHGAFLKALNNYDIPYDCFLPNFDKHSFEYSVKKTKEFNCNRLWVKINEGKQNYDIKTITELLMLAHKNNIEIVLVSQIPFFFRPGTTSHRLLNIYVSGMNISVSPIITLDTSPMSTDYVEKGIRSLVKTHKTIPSLYYTKNDTPPDVIVGYINNNILPLCNEIGLLNWKGTISLDFTRIFTDIYIPKLKKAERIEPIMATQKKPKVAKFPREMVVVSKTLGMRKIASVHSDTIGVLRSGEKIRVESMFLNNDMITFAEISREYGSNYFVIAERNNIKNIQDL